MKEGTKTGRHDPNGMGYRCVTMHRTKSCKLEKVNKTNKAMRSLK